MVPVAYPDADGSENCSMSAINNKEERVNAHESRSLRLEPRKTQLQSYFSGGASRDILTGEAWLGDGLTFTVRRDREGGIKNNVQEPVFTLCEIRKIEAI